MPRLERPSEDRLYLVDADEVRWRVYDVGFGPPHAPPFKRRVYELGSGRATERRFIGENGLQRVYRFARGESREITPEVLAQQLAGAGYAAREKHEPITRPW